jgi:hypothetical protein
LENHLISTLCIEQAAKPNTPKRVKTQKFADGGGEQREIIVNSTITALTGLKCSRS